MRMPIPTAVGGCRWAARPAAHRAIGAGPFTEQTLRELRDQCRRLAATNEFAINGHENRISYIVGPGHSYRAAVCKGMDAPDDVPMQVQKVLDEFEHENRWQLRQQEIVRRIDRDGEAFLRFFVDRDGLTRVRFIEPDQVATPTELGDRSGGQLRHSDRCRTMWKRCSATTSTASSSSAADVQHRRANVDFNVKRGLPLYTPVRKNLRRAEKLLRNMSIVAEIQSAIALIRKHRGASRSGIEQFVADRCRCDRHERRFRPHAALFAVRPGHDPRRAGRPGIRLPGPRPRCLELRHRAAGRAAGDRRAAGDARVHVHVRRLERELTRRRWSPKARP